MDSPQSVVSPFKNSPVSVEQEKQKSDIFVRNPGRFSGGVEAHRGNEGGMVCNMDDFVGTLEVYIHQARDIHNICIYHKQDVYAKLCLTSDPENAVSTKIINGGGQNPVFNDNLRLNVRTTESSLKCEIWMLSRVKNYLEDQLLGFALVPLSEVLISNGKLEKEFSLSSTDLFHSPAGFVLLSISYTGTSPEVMAIPASLATNASAQDSEISESMPSEYDAIEFPDPKIMNENQLMVSEYFGMPCTNLDSQSSEVTLDNGSQLNSEKIGVQIVESFSAGTIESIQLPKHDSPPSSVSTNGSPTASLPASSVSSDTSGTSKSRNEEHVLPPKEKTADSGDGESDSSAGTPRTTFGKPAVTVNIEPEQKVVQQEIVDMYMKSMQQFTESLAKMKLPMDIETGPTNSGNSSSDQKIQAAKNNNSSNNNSNSTSRVFYGSRAFF